VPPAFLADERDARLETIDVLAHGIDTAEELLSLVSRHESWALMAEVLSDVLYRWSPAAL